MITATEYAIVNLGSTVTLRASTPSLNFTPAIAWYDMDIESAHQAMASRVLLRSETPTPTFVSNLVVQFFDLGSVDVIDLAALDTTLDIRALAGATVLDHTTRDDGSLCADDGIYTSNGSELRIRRMQLAYRAPDGNSMLSVFTATTTTAAWDETRVEIDEMEGRWLQTTTTTSGSN